MTGISDRTGVSRWLETGETVLSEKRMVEGFTNIQKLTIHQTGTSKIRSAVNVKLSSRQADVWAPIIVGVCLPVSL